MICRRSPQLISNGALTSRISLRQVANAAVEDALRPMEQFTRRLIEARVVGNTNHKHRDGAKLWSAIPQAANPVAAPPSLEKSQFLAQSQALEGVDSDPLHFNLLSDNVRPGNFVELRRNRVVTHGVILGLAIIESRMHSLTLTYTGEVWPHLLNDITYAIPGFTAQDLMQRAGSSFEAADASETAARLEIVEQVRTFTRRHERTFNAMGRDIMSLYDKVRHPDADQWTDITTPEAARHLDIRKPPPILTLFAVHTHMMNRPLYFVADPRNHKTSQRFSVRPLHHVQIILQVNEWVRNRDPVLESFLRKARAVIKKARYIRDIHWDGSPSLANVHLPTWSPSELVFIRYLQNALRTTRTTQDDPYDQALPTLIKTLGLYNDRVVTQGLVHTVLCELGVIAPWDDVVARTPELRLDIAPPGESREAQTLHELVSHLIRAPTTPVSSIVKRKLLDVRFEGSTELHQRDLHASVRHDFGNMPVYVVDDNDAQELDDGLSIEPIVDKPGNYWVHIHVADPTTVIPPGHILDLRARHTGVTFYSAHRTWPMLPPALTNPLFSLGSKPRGEAQEVLTFSIKANDRGEFLDYSVRCGLVRNVQILHYGQVDRILGMKSHFRNYPLPGAKIPRSPEISIPESCHSDLQQLYLLADRISTRTLMNHSSLNYNLPRAQIRLLSPPPMNPILSSQPILWKGYPSMVYTVENTMGSHIGFRQIVAEWMKLACRAASRFCRDTGLPALRRTSTPLQAATEQAMAELLAMRAPNGFVDPFECMKRNIYAPPGEATLEPLEHWSLGVPKGEGYCRITSPLRRYGDLIMHWQIKHQLLPSSDRRTNGPLFPEEFLKPILYRQYDKEKTTNNAELLYHKHWAFAYLDRYIRDSCRRYGSGYNPFPGLIARSTGPVAFDIVQRTGQVTVYIPTLGIQGILKGVDQKLDPGIGTSFPVKITDISLGVAPTVTFGLA